MAVSGEITQPNDCNFSQSSLDMLIATWHTDNTV